MLNGSKLINPILKSFFKIGCIFIAVGLSSCSSFYTRHYTKGFYHETFVKKPSVDQFFKALETKASGNGNLKDTVGEKREIRLPVLNEQNNDRASLIKQNDFQKPEKKGRSFRKIVPKIPLVSAGRVLQKKLRSGSSGDSPLGKALLYILAIILALAIVALAIYFLPAILIPAPVSSAFMTLVLIAIIVVLVIFVLLIYSLAKHLISLFKHKKAVPEDDL